MIQRIQSIYLLLVFIFALLFIFLPIGTFQYADSLYHVGFMGIVSEDGSQHLESSYTMRMMIMIIPFIIMLLTAVTIFRYQKRLLQISLGKLNLLIHVFLVVITFFYLDGVRSQYPGFFSYGTAIVFPLISMVWILLANRAIRRDENLVRSADRLR